MNQTIQTKPETGLALLQQIFANPKLTGFFLTGESALSLSTRGDNIEKAEIFTLSEFNAGELAVWLTSEFEVTLVKIGNNLLEAQFEKLKVYIFRHPYKLLSQPKSIQGIEVAGQEDIAVMSIRKIITGQCLYSPELLWLKNRFSFKQLLDLYLEKYPESSADDLEAMQNKLFFS